MARGVTHVVENTSGEESERKEEGHMCSAILAQSEACVSTSQRCGGEGLDGSREETGV